jgi:hypothetical protein
MPATPIAGRERFPRRLDAQPCAPRRPTACSRSYTTSSCLAFLPGSASTPAATSLGTSAAAAQRARAVVEGVDGVYVDHLLRVRRLAARHGRRPLYWADVLEKHPHHVVLLPADVGLLFWNYDAAPSAAALTNRLRRLTSPGGKRSIRGELWVCPGTSAWNSLFFRRDNAAANIFQTARAGHAVGASGFLLTDWGDNGHYNFATASLWPMAFAAECAWNAPKRRPTWPDSTKPSRLRSSERPTRLDRCPE